MTIATWGLLDCPECSSAGSVEDGVCQICLAEDIDQPEATAGLPPAASEPVAATGPGPMVHPSVPLRFSDVISELRMIADLAAAAVEVEGSYLARACHRAESLLLVLREQFFREVVLPGGRPAVETGASRP
jgi:hypothetical protein